MVQLKQLLISVALSFSAIANAADTPLNFDYVATGANGVRPSLIFNDGTDTFIQPLNGQSISGDLIKAGPYFVLKGLPNEFSILINSQTVYIKKQTRSTPSKIQPIDEVKSKTPSTPVSTEKINNDLVLKRGDSLAATVLEYGKARGITVNWQSTKDMNVKKNLRITGSDSSLMLIDFLKSVGYESGGTTNNIFVMDKIKDKS